MLSPLVGGCHPDWSQQRLRGWGYCSWHSVSQSSRFYPSTTKKKNPKSRKCVGASLYVYLYVESLWFVWQGIFTCVYIHVEAWGSFWVSFLKSYSVFNDFWESVSNWDQGITILAWLFVRFSSTGLCLAALKLQSYATMPSFLVDSESSTGILILAWQEFYWLSSPALFSSVVFVCFCFYLLLRGRFFCV